MAVLETVDHTIITGFRGEDAQNEMFRTGRSQHKFPNGKHNLTPSKAIDAAPYPIDWKDEDRFIYLAGHVRGIAKMLKEQGKIIHDIGWGRDWDGDTELKDNNFNDFGHFYLKVPRGT